MENSHLEDMLMCPVCQDIFTDPRQLPCGHSVCLACLEGLMSHSSGVGFRCPDCREDFGPGFGIQKSYTLSNIAEDFRANRMRTAQRHEHVVCDCCSEGTTPALKTCLKCEVSFCKEHIGDHLELPAYTGHPLVTPLDDLQERKCPQHGDAVLRYYCSTTRRYICNICALEAKQLNAATEACTVLRRQLTEYMDTNFQTLEEKMLESSEHVQTLQANIEQKKQTGNYGDSSVNGVTVVLLCLWFIVLYYAYNYSVEKKSLSDALNEQQNRMLQMYSTMAELLVGHPQKGQQAPVAQNQGSLTLDVDTVSPFLGLSPDLQSVERLKTKLNYPNQKTRFEEAPQVLSTHCVSTGTHTWEVEVEGYWDVAVSYRSIRRKSKDSSAFGNNAASWSLRHNDKGELFAYHNKIKQVLPADLRSSRITVKVSFEMGSITFSTSGPEGTNLHQFKATLTEPVCLGLGLYNVDPPSRASIIKIS